MVKTERAEHKEEEVSALPSLTQSQSFRDAYFSVNDFYAFVDPVLIFIADFYKPYKL